jgi:hypothetical protein
MNIEELLNELVFSDEYEGQIRNDNNLINYIDNKVFTSVFYAMVGLLEDFPIVQRKFIKGFTDQPQGCGNINIVLFSQLTQTGRASNNKWIARMPLQINHPHVIIYLPRDIVVANEKLLRFEDKPDGTQRFRYAIPKDINQFIKNPSAYISLVAVEGRLNN